MKSTVEPLEGNKVKLSITVEASELEPAVDAAWKQIAKEVKIPGFRAGKVPRKVLEARVDPTYARSEALQSAVPEFYTQAVREHDVDVIAQPEIDITDGEESGDIAFDAVVEIRPEIEIAGYQGLSVEIPSPHPSDDDVADQIDRIRSQYGELSAVDRPAIDGDHVSIDIAGTSDGEPVDGLTADDYLYEVGSGTVVAELDVELRGKKPGDIVTFEAQHPDPDEGQVQFRVLVKDVKERLLPELSDEWVAEATEFETVDALRDDVISRLTNVRKTQANMALQSKLGDALAELVTDEVPDSLVGSEMRARLEDMVHRLSHQGITLEQYLSITGTEPQAFSDDLRETAVQATKVDLALRAIAVAEGLTATDAELDEQIEQLASTADIDVDVAREQLDTAGRLSDLRADLTNRNALKWLNDLVIITDEAGNPIRREELEVPDDPAEHEHDHDHDHEGHDHDHDHDHEH